MTKHLSPFLCGYRKGFSALISLLENWKVTLDKNGYAGAILMDLSKAFDCLNHDLLIAKLYAYGFSKNAVAIIRSYLNCKGQKSTFLSVPDLNFSLGYPKVLYKVHCCLTFS